MKTVRKAIFIAAVIYGAWSARAHAEKLPLNPAVTQATIQQTVCKKGWTSTIRPPASTTNAIKRKLFEEFGLPLELMVDFRLDHRIPLVLGGAPLDRQNLILQDEDDSERKDETERCLSREVCDGLVSLADAQQAIWTDWKAAHALCAKGFSDKETH